MKKRMKQIAFFLSAAMLFAGCGSNGAVTEESDMGKEQNTDTKEEVSINTALDKINAAKWNYNEEDDVYWQVGISYCENPAAEEYETLGIFVPGAYMDAADNGDGTYTCSVKTDAVVGGYSAETAPIVIPVDTPGYSAMAAPADYVQGVSNYTSAGFIYVGAGCRGRDAGAPAGVTDLKAAIRYIRYNEGEIPGSTDRIFSFGMSGGGAQSALLGATGDSDLYTPYLETIGAVEGVSDAVAGSMCWCPITNLDYANEAYEWNMGVTRTDLDEEMQNLSDSMAEEFAKYINELGIKDEDGNVLVLTESEEGIYQAGSYYEYIKSVVEESLNNFLEDTTFPYDADSLSGGMMRGANGGRGGFGGNDGDIKELTEEELQEMMENGNMPERKENGKFGGEKTEGFEDGNLPGRGKDGAEMELPEGEDKTVPELPEGEKAPAGAADGAIDYEAIDDINRNTVSGGISLSGTYETAEDYIAALNAETEWVTYDAATNTVTITSVADFVKALKPASKNVGAFDDLDGTQGENVLFGYGDGNGAHFDAVMAELLSDNETYGAAYAGDLTKTDALGNTVDYRLNMYNPMYYLAEYYEGYDTANVAEYWRIRTGINQGDTALTTEVNLALALENYGADVDFATVWGQGHVEAERTGDSTTNFIEWVNACLQER